MSVLQPGATAGPVDMSVALNLYLPEAALLAQALGSDDIVSALATRLTDASRAAENNGSPTLQITLSPSEQGMLMGALRQCTCSFSSGLRFRLQQKMVSQLKSVGAPESL